MALSEENAALKSGLDDAKAEVRVAKEKANILENVLEQRSNTDDVQVLRNELHNVQQVVADNMIVSKLLFESYDCDFPTFS